MYCTIKNSATKAGVLFPRLLLFSIILFSKANAQGNLLVTPKRVVFEGQKRSEELNIANTGKDTATYIISFIQIRMTSDGQVQQITEPDSAQNFADKYLRFFPRRITLAPNEAQTVKVQIIRTNEITPGEYRSHLYFRAIPNDKPLGDKEPENDNSISVKLVPIFGISLPVIIRAGETTAQLHFSDVSVNTEKNPVLKMTFNRTGNMSVYGDISAEYISPSGKTTKIGVAKGVAVYTPNTTRNFNLQLENKPEIDYHQGKIHLVFTDQSAKPVKLAEDEITLN
jgi:P pilus assembly chaperone PapD